MMSRVACILFYILLVMFFPCPDASALVYSSISGRIIAEDTGTGLANVTVWAILVGGGHGDYHYGSTDTGGVYVLKDLNPGTYLIGFSKENDSYLNEKPHAEIVLQKGKHAVNVNHVLTPGGSVSGTVYQSDGTTPMAGIGVYASVSGTQESWIEYSKYSPTDIDGKFLLRGLPQSDDCTVEIMVPGHARLTKTVKTSKGKVTGNVNFIVNWDDATGINGYVTSSVDGNPVKNAKVDLTDSSGNDIGTARTDDSGKYSIVAVLPGVYGVTAFWPEGDSWIEKKNISVKYGKSTIVNFEFDKPAPTAMNFETIGETLLALFVSNAYAQGGGGGYPELKFEFCADNQSNPVKAAYEKVKKTVDGSSCISKGTKPMMQDKLRKGIVIECAYAPCTEGTYAQSKGNKIQLCPKAFVPVFGCLEATLLHELAHLVGYTGENVPYECEKKCFPGCSKVPADYPGKDCGC
jgi:Carboxypeptidase regulatory-like domain